MQEALDLLENSTFVEVLLCIISGKDYSSAIAKTLKKSQPTVTEQLKQLEAAQLIKALNRKKPKNMRSTGTYYLTFFMTSFMTL